MQAKLVALRGVAQGEEFYLPRDKPVVLGRSEEATYSLMHNKISRAHCKIEFESGLYSIEDLKSKNGTWVNGKKIRRAILFHSDMVLVGEEEFRFELEPDFRDDSDDVGLAVREGEDTSYKTDIKRKVDYQDASSVLMTIATKSEMEVDGEELERDLSAICRIISVVQSRHELEELFEGVMDAVMEVSEADRGYLIVGKEAGGIIMPLVTRYSERVPPSAQGSFSRSIVKECYENGYATLRADPFQKESDLTESIYVQEIHSIICVPLPSEGGSVGVIYVDRITGSRGFGERDLKVLTAIGNQAGIAIHRAQLARRVETLFSDTVRTLVNVIEVKDEYTLGHSERVTAVALRVGELLGLSKGELRILRLGGLLHDLGKIAINLEVLRKPGTLSQSEYSQIQEHAALGAKIVDRIDNAGEIAAAMRHHHERWDGTGYPAKLAGESIPKLARILAVGDAFDAMCSDRPYRKALTEEEIVAEFQKNQGTQFDPHMAEVFVDAFRSDKAFQARIRKIYAKRQEAVQPTGVL